jgi:hypothetical protein
MNPEVLSGQIPAECGLACVVCRTPEHNEGNPKRVLGRISELVASGNYRELYITSNGETGRSPIFSELVRLCQEKGVSVSVLCATQISVVPGLKRVEVSVNAGTVKTAHLAIKKAKDLRIPVVVSMIDDGTMPVDPESVANEYAVDGVLIRALQQEGRSIRSGGRTQVYQRPGSDLGMFPSSCYAELAGIGYASDCISHNGEMVPLLGGVAIA